MLILYWQHKSIELLCCSCFWKCKERQTIERLIEQLPVRRCSKCNKKIILSKLLKRNLLGSSYLENLTMDWLDFTKEVYCYACIRKERESRPPSEVQKKLKELQNICELWRYGKTTAGQLIKELGLKKYNFRLLVNGERTTKGTAIKLGERIEILLEKPVHDYSDLIHKLVERTMSSGSYDTEKISQIHQMFSNSLSMAIGMWKVGFSQKRWEIFKNIGV